VALIGIAVVAAGVARFHEALGGRRLLPRPAEDPDQRRREVAEAFSRAPQELTEAEERAIRELFDGLNGALQRSDAVAVGNHFDADRMLAEMERQPGWPSYRLGQRRQILTGMAAGIGQSLVRNPLFRWDRIRIQRYYPAEGPPEALVYVRHFSDEDSVSFKTRWWLMRDGDRWRVYDFEDLDAGNRASSTMGVAMASLLAARQPPPWMSAVRDNLQPAYQAIAAGETDRAERQLTALPAGLPGTIDAVRLALLASIRLGQNRAEECLQLLDQAEARNPDLPMAHALRAAACNQLGRFEDAVRHGRRHIELLGDDANTYEQIGIALERLSRHDEAADAYRKALDDVPDSPELLRTLCRLLPGGQKKEIGERFARLKKPAEDFEVFADWFVDTKDRAALDVLLEVYKAAPDDPVVAYYRALGRILAGEFGDADAGVRAAIPRLPDDKRPSYVTRFLSAMTDAGRMLDGYRAAPDPVQAFRFLADELLETSDPKQNLDRLRELMAEHRKRQPDDVWLDYFEGEAQMAAKNYDAAEQAYAAGAARASDDDTREMFRSARVYARVEGGKGLSAYAEIGPRKKTFDQLAQLFTAGNRTNELNELLAAHRANDPADADLPVWQAEYHWLRKEYGPVVDILTEHRALADQPLQSWRYGDRLVRSLVRLQRFADARREFNALPEKTRPPILDTVVAAAAGDVDGTARALAAQGERGYGVLFLYRDADLGPALRSEPFRALREKYPEPPSEPIKRDGPG
jgi:tetratricopeptide (TPR) repeat protein